MNECSYIHSYVYCLYCQCCDMSTVLNEYTYIHTYIHTCIQLLTSATASIIYHYDYSTN